MISKICIICGKEYFFSNNRQKTCGKECGVINKRKLSIKSYLYISKPQLKAINCLYCGTEFIPKHGNQKICSEDCRQKHIREFDRKRKSIIGGQPSFELGMAPLKVQKVGVVERRGPQILGRTSLGVYYPFIYY